MRKVRICIGFIRIVKVLFSRRILRDSVCQKYASIECREGEQKITVTLPLVKIELKTDV